MMRSVRAHGSIAFLVTIAGLLAGCDDTSRFAGDSITGTISWYTYLGVASRAYEGTYIARRRR